MKISLFGTVVMGFVVFVYNIVHVIGNNTTVVPVDWVTNRCEDTDM